MNNNIMEYCYNCDEDKPVIIKEESIKMTIKDIEIDFVGKVAYCKECGEEVYISQIDDENVIKANEKYRDKTAYQKLAGKSIFQIINNVLRWMSNIVLIGFAIFHFFVHENPFKGLNFIIFWCLLGLSHLTDVIDAKFFKNNFTMKKKGLSIVMVVMSMVFIILEMVL